MNIDEDTAKLIWRPKVTFFDVLSVEKNDGVGYKHVPEYYFVPNRQVGELQISEQLKMKFPCNFQFDTFPFDEHECNLTFYERQYYAKTLILNSPIQIFHGNQKCCPNESSALILTDPKSPFKIEVQINPFTFLHDGYATYSISGLKLKLKRDSIELLIGSFFVPTGIFAILSMMSYVINPDVVGFKHTSKKMAHLVIKSTKVLKY